jgi:glycosyltransferase involved in cell wall biosynthesis
VSVVIGTRNRRALLERTLGTVLWQTHDRLEVLVVDDGSTDDTAAWVAAHPDERVSLLHRAESGGVADARNAGLARARGTYVAVTDDDDLWAPTKLAAQLRGLEQLDGARWSCASTVVVDTGLRPVQWQPAPPSGRVERSLLEVNRIPGGASGVLAEAALVAEVGGFDPSFRHFADWDLWIRLARAAPMASVHEPLLAYLRHDSMSNVAANKYEDVALMEERYRERRRSVGAPSPVGHNLHWIGLTALRAGDVDAAVRAYLAAAGEPTVRLSRLRARLARVPGFLELYDAVTARRVPPAVRRSVEPWLAAARVDPAAPRSAVVQQEGETGSPRGRMITGQTAHTFDQ